MVVLAVAVVKIILVLLLEVQASPGKVMLAVRVVIQRVVVAAVPVLWVKIFQAQAKAALAARELDQLLPEQMLPMLAVAVVAHSMQGLFPPAALAAAVPVLITKRQIQ
jgi:hypothetical protein